MHFWSFPQEFDRVNKPTKIIFLIVRPSSFFCRIVLCAHKVFPIRMFHIVCLHDTQELLSRLLVEGLRLGQIVSVELKYSMIQGENRFFTFLVSTLYLLSIWRCVFISVIDPSSPVD